MVKQSFIKKKIWEHLGKHVFPPLFAFPFKGYSVHQSLKLRSIPPCIIHHFSWFFEPVIMVIVMCMICKILHDHFAWFCMILLILLCIPLHIKQNFSWFFELVIMVIVMCMICRILHDHFAWFCMILLLLLWIPLHIMQHFSWFFEPIMMVIVMCMICMILHDYF